MACMMTPQEKQVVTYIAVGATLMMFISMLLCACGWGIGCLIGIAKGVAENAGG
jgi:hypothetical protein